MKAILYIHTYIGQQEKKKQGGTENLRLMRCDFVRGKRKLRDFDTWFRRFGKECVYITEGIIFQNSKMKKVSKIHIQEIVLL